MRIERLSLTKEIMLQFGLKEWPKVEMVLDEGDDAKEAFNVIKQFIAELYHKHTQDPAPNTPPEQLPEIQIENNLSTREETIQTIIDEINLVDDFIELEKRYSIFKKTYPEIAIVYNIRHELLKDKKVKEILQKTEALTNKK